MKTMVERFWEKVDLSDKKGCWTWTAALDGKGYGQFPSIYGRGAHRTGYALANGPIPPGIHVLHRCDNPPCVRPGHLFLGTPGDNMKDMVTKGRSKSKETHCRNGHLFDEQNTYWRPDRPGRRTCRACNRDASTKYYPKRKK